MKLRLLVVILLLALSTAVTAEDADRIYNSNELIITQKSASTAYIPSGISRVEAQVAFFPQNTFRQTVLDQFSVPSADINDNLLSFIWEDPTPGTYPFSVQTQVRTTNNYLEITNKVPFPIAATAIPDSFQQYLEATDNIDINDAITSQANLLASGKDDLFTVAHEIAVWIERSIEYDLSTTTAEVSQSASWTLQNKVGVCDELTSLYIAMMRSLGVPARFASGISYTNSPLFEEPWGPHAWAEVYFPNYGWVPFDITYRQFGHIDASHIKLKTSTDADQSLTKYFWTGTGNTVSIDALAYDTTIEEYIGTVPQYIEVSIDPYYDQVGYGSSNLVEIELENLHPYYISTTLNVASPPEIELPYYLVVMLKPLEKKTLQLPVEIPILESGYTYTMPLQVKSTYGQTATTNFKVAQQYTTYTKKHIEALIENEESANAGTLSTDCSTQPFALAGHPFQLQCIITNKGNVFYQDVELCLDSVCETTDIGISQKATIAVEQFEADKGQYTVPLYINVPGKKEYTRSIPFVVHGEPEFTFDSNFPQEINFIDSATAELTISPASGSLAQNIEVKVYAGVDAMKFEIPLLDRTHILQVPILGDELKEGENTVKIEISYTDITGNAYKKQEESSIRLNDLTFTQKIQSWIKRSLRTVFK